MKNSIKKIFRKLKLEVSNFPTPDLRRRMLLLKHHRINTIIDVGANTGQYATEMYGLGFEGTIVSFEPLSKAYSILNHKIKSKKNWTAVNVALGSANHEATINVASNLASSSILSMKEAHKDAAPDVSFSGSEKITVVTLDSVWDKYFNNTNTNYYLKIDTQGYEKDVLMGAEKSLSKITGIQLEMSLTELYEGEWLFDQMVEYLAEKGFKLHSVEPQFYNTKTGQLLQLDGIFYRK
jgi:FkbM family methyltransferase